MIKGLMLIAFIAAAIGAMSAGIVSSMEKTAGLKSAVNELNILTDDTIHQIGTPATLENIKKAQQILEERKNTVKELIASVERTEGFRKDSEIGMELENCKNSNLDKIVEAYENLLSKTNADLEKLNDLKEQKLNANSKLSGETVSKINAQIINQTKAVKENVDSLNAIAELVKSYRTIFEDKQKEENV